MAVVFSLVALVSWIVALREDGGVLRVEPYTRPKKAASLAILLSSCCDIGRIFDRLPEYAALLVVFKKLLPAFAGQATVVFTLMHVFCYVGMYKFGGKVTSEDPMWADKDFPGNLYYCLNFNTYPEGMGTYKRHGAEGKEMGVDHCCLTPFFSHTIHTCIHAVTLFALLIVNNWNLIAANFVALTGSASYLYFMAYQIAVVTIGLNCVTSFFIGNLSNKLVEELEAQKEKKKKKKGKDEEAQARVRSLGPGPPGREHVIKFKVERRVSSDDLMLTNEEPVDATEYRALLDAMMRETGDRTGYSFVKENADTGHPQTVQRSPFYLEIVERYGGEVPILQRIKGLFEEELARRRAREESGGAEPLQPYSVVDTTLSRNEGTQTGMLQLRVYVLTDSEELLAYCQIRECGVTAGRSPKQASGHR